MTYWQVSIWHPYGPLRQKAFMFPTEAIARAAANSAHAHGLSANIEEVTIAMDKGEHIRWMNQLLSDWGGKV